MRSQLVAFRSAKGDHLNQYIQGVTMSIVIGLFLMLSILLNIAKGRIRGRGGYVHRGAAPVPFWLIIALKSILGLALIFPTQLLSVVQFGIKDTRSETRRKVEEFQQRQLEQKQETQPRPQQRGTPTPENPR
jgi:hypothetical protein